VEHPEGEGEAAEEDGSMEAMEDTEARGATATEMRQVSEAGEEATL
jgi:hypothetical protein